jgi:glutathione S-transferase
MFKLYHIDPDKDWIGGAREAAKVAIAIRELTDDFEIIYVDRKQDLRNPDSEFRKKLNPDGEVPVLDHDGFILAQSVAILNYLTSVHPGNPLRPEDPKKRAIVDQWVMWEATALMPALVKMYFTAMDKNEGIDHCQSCWDQLLRVPGMESAVADYNKKLGRLERQLEGKKFVVGEYTMADIPIGCCVGVGLVIGAGLNSYPNISNWIKRLEDKASWQAERTFVRDVASGRNAGLVK